MTEPIYGPVHSGGVGLGSSSGAGLGLILGAGGGGEAGEGGEDRPPELLETAAEWQGTARAIGHGPWFWLSTALSPPEPVG